jgi:acyl-CoA thioesterase
MQLKCGSVSCMTQLTDVAIVSVDESPVVFDGTALMPTGEEGVFDVRLDDAWSSLVGTHGGYMVALNVCAAQALIPGRAARTISTSFGRSGRTGPATVRAISLRSGRSITNVEATLEQDGRALVTSRITLVAPSDGVDWDRPEPLPIPPFDACVPIAPPDRVKHLERARARLDPASLPFTDGPETSVRGYIRPLGDEPIDAAWLAMMCDWFPPPAFVRMTPPVGGISVDMFTHVHRTLPPLDADEWLTGWFEIRTSRAGLATEHGCIATTDGVVLAESMQTRWTVARG